MGNNQHTNGATQDELDEIRRLHGLGHSRNGIARLIGRGGRFVSEHAARMGLDFDRAKTEAATAARKADLEERRTLLADLLVDDALRLRARIWEPTFVYNIGGKDNTFTKEEVPEPPPADKRALMTAATAAAAQSLRLVPPETETEGMAAVDQWLRGMMGGTPAPE